MLLRVIERQIDALPERVGAMSVAARERRVSELEAELFVLGQHEEALITQGAAAGQDVLRRVDADARAVLGIVVVKAQEAVA